MSCNDVVGDFCEEMRCRLIFQFRRLFIFFFGLVVLHTYLHSKILNE